MVLKSLHALDNQEDTLSTFPAYCWHTESNGTGSYLVLFEANLGGVREKK